jgi:hypothetical protein
VSNSRKPESPGLWTFSIPAVGLFFYFVTSLIVEYFFTLYGFWLGFVGYILGAAIGLRFLRKARPRANFTQIFTLWISLGLAIWLPGAMIMYWFVLPIFTGNTLPYCHWYCS